MSKEEKRKSWTSFLFPSPNLNSKHLSQSECETDDQFLDKLIYSIQKKIQDYESQIENLESQTKTIKNSISSIKMVLENNENQELQESIKQLKQSKKDQESILSNKKHEKDKLSGSLALALKIQSNFKLLPITK